MRCSRLRLSHSYGIHQDIERIEAVIRDHRADVRKVLRVPSLDYVSVSGQDVCWALWLVSGDVVELMWGNYMAVSH